MEKTPIHSNQHVKATPKTKGTIAIVSETYRPEVNGVANTLSYWVDGLISLGYKIQVFRPRQNPKDTGTETGSELQVTTTGLPIPRYPELKFGLPNSQLFASYWSDDKPLAVYVATEGPLGWSASKVARSFGIPVISGFHTNFQSYSQFYGFGWLEKLIMAYLRNFHNNTLSTLVPTKDQASYLNNRGFKNTQVLSRGVDCSRFSPSKRSAALRKEWGVSHDSPVCIYVGRLANEKNVELLIESYCRLSESNPEVKFVFVGDGPARPRLESSCPNAIFAGMQRGESLAEHYASADIFMFPSKTDTFGNVVTEAMASGLAVVAFNDSAAKEHLEHEVSGLIADLDQDKTYLDLIDKAVNNRELLRTVRTNSLELAKSITWSQIVQRFEAILVGESQHQAASINSNIDSCNRQARATA